MIQAEVGYPSFLNMFISFVVKLDNKQELHWNKDSIDQDVTYNFTSYVTVVEGK
ncbi:hypothetical protein H5410_011804, partial [Solanum commersonii]